MRGLAALPQDQREVIVLKIWHRHTFEEIGELLDISPNTVAGRYRYGLQKLRMLLKGPCYDRMNEMSELEKQLLSWTPRRPSAGLERRIVAAGPATAEALPSFRFSWLAPATAALMLMCVLFNQRYGPS